MRAALCSDFTIGKAKFRAAIVKVEEGVILKAAWIIENRTALSMQSLADFFGFELPDILSWELELKKCELSFNTKNQAVLLTIVIQNFGDLSVSSSKVQEQRMLEMVFKVDRFFGLKRVPIIGELVQGNDGFTIERFRLAHSLTEPLTAELIASFMLGGLNIPLPLRYERQAVKAFDADNANEADKPEIKWINVNKSFKVLYIKRIGFLLLGSKVKLMLDAKFTVAILDIDFFELFVSLDMSDGWKFDFGLSGLEVMLKKPPVIIAGGLYKSSTQTLYNGKLLVSVSKLTLTALGSYAVTPNGKSSFFVFLALNYPLGGPSFFFITGLALGFGVHRKLKLPELNEIRTFPLVAAAMGAPGAEIGPDTEPAQALNALSGWVVTSEGDFFGTVGVQFTSFCLVKTTALLTVEFGNKLRISLLGLSTISIPPQIGGKAPSSKTIAYAELAIRAIIAPDEGVFEVIGVLTKKSYLFTPDCHLTGGFAFCMWTKGEYAGDFIVTLGGCHHRLFKNKHYPVLDKVGINWAITKELSLSANGYFALTPNCIMAGIQMQLTYDGGFLKAWVKALAEFYVAWKPFFYDVLIEVSVGASCTLKIWFVSITFKIELSARLHIWGPEFSGTIDINWFIISFRIGFGNASQKPPPISFSEFKESFLPERYIDISFSGGVTKELKEQNSYVVNPYQLVLHTHTAIPCTSITLNGKKEITGSQSLGIYPMGKTTLQSEKVVIFQKQNTDGTFMDISYDDLLVEVENENISPALWSRTTPDVNALPIKDVPTGLKIMPKKKEPAFMLPKSGGSYDMDILMERECILNHTIHWGNESLPKAESYFGCDVIKSIEGSWKHNENRKEILVSLGKSFGAFEDVNIRDIGDSPQKYFYSLPTLITTGA